MGEDGAIGLWIEVHNGDYAFAVLCVPQRHSAASRTRRPTLLRASCRVDRRHHALASQRKVANADAERVEYRIGNRRGCRTGNRFTQTE